MWSDFSSREIGFKVLQYELSLVFCSWHIRWIMLPNTQIFKKLFTDTFTLVIGISNLGNLIFNWGSLLLETNVTHFKKSPRLEFGVAKFTVQRTDEIFYPNQSFVLSMKIWISLKSRCIFLKSFPVTPRIFFGKICLQACCGRCKVGPESHFARTEVLGSLSCRF